ncbi:hypothetical protein ACOI1H_24940, partial [Loktanella sp. DJP18]|uniref:hypothetical protein n=1 Tax=Loktanella sp. DJP18 TaxID=3409788 RepID=UPI003BB8038C
FAIPKRYGPALPASSRFPLTVPAKELQYLGPPQLPEHDRTARAVSPMHLIHILCQIEPDRDDTRLIRSPRWIVADPP